jgi:hypothetical protein
MYRFALALFVAAALALAPAASAAPAVPMEIIASGWFYASSPPNFAFVSKGCVVEPTGYDGVFDIILDPDRHGDQRSRVVMATSDDQGTLAFGTDGNVPDRVTVKVTSTRTDPDGNFIPTNTAGTIHFMVLRLNQPVVVGL